MDYIDSLLVQRFQEGDMRAFEEIVRRYGNRLYNMACRMMGDRGDAEDITQEVFIRAYHSLSRFQRKSRLYTWLYRIAVNLCLDRLRKWATRVHEVSLDAPVAVGETEVIRAIQVSTPTPEDEVERKELKGIIEGAINELSPKHRAVVVLHDIQCLKYEEIASVLGCSIGTVKSRLFYARCELKDKLRPYLSEMSKV